ncbi:MAG: DUF6179 domain-containing protein [bacterium]|nr:DUF6179 domain-containing protein [bacterium]
MSRFEMEDLLPVVAVLAEKYTSKESSSITYEKANQLMEAVLYCIKEYDQGKKNQVQDPEADKGKVAMQTYEEGYDLVCKKVLKTNQLYIAIMETFDSYGSICYDETIKKGMEAFFKHYDVRFSPQDTLLTLDYPVLDFNYALQGIDAIYTYLSNVLIEQTFLSAFPREYVIDVLRAYDEDYEEMFYNIARVVYRAMTFHLLANKPLAERGYSKEEYERLGIAIISNTNKELKEQLELALYELTKQLYDKNSEVFEYLRKDLDDFVTELRNAAENQVLDVMFPL